MVCTKISGQDQIKLERSILTIIKSIGRWQLGFLIKSFAMQKKAAAISNLAIGKLETKIGQEIIKVCDEIIDEKLNDQFPLSVWQTGSGTQTKIPSLANCYNLGRRSLSAKKKKPSPHRHALLIEIL